MSFALIPFLGFAIATSVTPGPNNIMVAASAARNGVRATLPHMLGIAVGFGVMVLVVGLGLSAPLTRAPGVQAAARWVGVAWLVYLAWQIATAAAPGEGAVRPLMGFRGGALFQWINPKAWLLAIGVATAWVSPDAPAAPQIATMAFLFFLVGMPCNLVWAALGAKAAGLLHSPGRLRAFNVTMAALLVASVVPLVLE